MVIPSTSSQFSAVLEPPSLRSSYDIQIVGIKTIPEKKTVFGGITTQLFSSVKRSGSPRKC